MDREQVAWAVISAPTHTAPGLQKEAGLLSSAAARLGKAKSWLSGGKSMAQHGAAIRGSFRDAGTAYTRGRQASRTPAEIARLAKDPADATRMVNETARAKRLLRAKKRAAQAAGAGTVRNTPGINRAAGNVPAARPFGKAKPKGMFDSIIDGGTEFAKNNPGTTAAGLAALGIGGKMLHGAYKAYNSPLGRATRFARKNPLVAGAGVLGAGMVAKGALSDRA